MPEPPGKVYAAGHPKIRQPAVSTRFVESERGPSFGKLGPSKVSAEQRVDGLHALANGVVGDTRIQDRFIGHARTAHEFLILVGRQRIGGEARNDAFRFFDHFLRRQLDHQLIQRAFDHFQVRDPLRDKGQIFALGAHFFGILGAAAREFRPFSDLLPKPT